MLRIALTADPELPVPPAYYGGIERIIDMLGRGLVDRGHEVTLFAHSQSASAGQLVRWTGLSSRSVADTVKNATTLARHVRQQRFDLVHSFSRLAYLVPLLSLSIPKLMTYQRAISRRSVYFGHFVSRGSLWFSAISRWMMHSVESIGTWRLVFNGVPLTRYEYRPQVAVDAPLLFLGRIEQIKGPHIAIEVAQRTGIPLVIAGNVSAEHRAWFEVAIMPHIDGSTVSFVGPVNDAEKSELLGRARALLMPISWEEPFGIVMVEAMACGTPVLGFARGAVPEVIAHGVTGFVCNDLEDLIAAICRVNEIDRAACRARVEQLFSDQRVVEAYLDVYREMLDGRGG